jgi:soluble lytic murein transglycosylase
LKAAEKLGRRTLRAAPPACSSVKDATLPAVENSLDRLRRPLRADLSMSGDAVAELTFLRLWDEASLWFERQNTRPDPRTGAELAYAGGRYRRSIAYADRLPESDKSRLPLVYPAGFREIVCAASRRFDVDPLWLHAIIWQESKYDPFARSGASARGLMQFIPETANDVGRAIGLNEFSLNRLYEPGVVIPMGAYYFDSLMKKLKHPAMALAAYNGGLTNVNRWKGKWPGAAADDLELFVADIGFIETKRYVMAVFAARAAYEELAR